MDGRQAVNRGAAFGPARRRHLLLLCLAVLAAHLGVGEQLADAARDLALHAAPGAMRRMSAQFVVQLVPAATPRVPADAAPAPAPRQRGAQAGAARASAVAAGASSVAPSRAEAEAEDASMSPALGAAFEEALPQATLAPPAAPLAAPAPQVPRLPAATPAPDPVLVDAPADPGAVRAGVVGPIESARAASAADAVAGGFEWPRSTRLSYRLTGQYRGPVHGSARVEWLRQGRRYQVHVEVAVGPSVAPLVARRLSSEGEIRPEGLHPRLYEEETRAAWQAPRRHAVRLTDEVVRLAHGVELPRPDGVQDSASQFVQMTWLFITQPQRLQAGGTVTLPLALPRRVDEWIYDIGQPETLYTEQGPIEAVPVRPRPIARPSGELSAELWVAPSLQHLPVRILIRQSADTYVDLLLDRLPEQAADPPR